MIDLKTAESIHNILIDKFGGSKGIRDIGSLQATFDQKDLYPTSIDKASALFESIIINHPFVDGNKRISYVLMRIILLHDNLDIVASQSEKYNFVISASKGESHYDEIKQWLKDHIVTKNEP
mgnify:CR=1 FL=1